MNDGIYSKKNVDGILGSWLATRTARSRLRFLESSSVNSRSPASAPRGFIDLTIRGYVPPLVAQAAATASIGFGHRARQRGIGEEGVRTAGWAARADRRWKRGKCEN
jgi:hypothetical protein